ncbi:hypothetical protein vseg_017377 [Gypsophila vaccaria]
MQKLVIHGINMMKSGRGRGPTVMKTVSCTMLLLLVSSVRSLLHFTNKAAVEDHNPFHQLLFATHLLHSSLLGFILFLALMIDRLHYYVRELHLRRKAMEALKKTDEDIKAREMQLHAFKDMMRHMESELEANIKEASSSGATVEALRKQTQGLLFEYHRLLAQNQKLRSRLQILDRRLSHSAVKKDS